MSNPNGSRLRHGHRRNGNTSPEYSVWMGMRSRCLNSNDMAFKDYGGRGIGIDVRWNEYEAFFEDMGARPSPKHTIDRIDNSKGYGPGNCRWATWKEQQRNRRSNVIYTVDGVTATLAEHCERTGIKYKTAHRRLVQGASIDVAINPSRPPYGSIRRCALNITIGRLHG